MPRHLPFICVEGVDGVGKTTTANLLADKLGAVYYRTPAGPFAAARADVDASRDPTARGLFYLASVFAAASEIAALLAERPVVCDRYVFSTLAYHAELDVPLIKCFELIRERLLMPDVTFLLTADAPTRAARRAQRGDHGIYEEDDGFLDRVQNRFRSLGLTEVETGTRGAEEVAAILADRTEVALATRRTA